MKFTHTLSLVAAFAVTAANAQPQPADHASHHPASAAASAASAPAAAASAMADGEVRRVDKDAGKITLRHGPIANLDMPGMTMVFRVADPKMLDGWKEGDRIRFTAARVNGALTVTSMEAVK